MRVLYYCVKMVATYTSAGRTPHVIYLVLLVVGCNAVYAYDGNKSAITCQAGTFSAGDTANITCYFQRNISAEGVHIFVGWRPLNAAGGSKESRALACFKTSSKGMACISDSGFSFNQDISNRLTVMIPKVTFRYAGDYTCRQIPQLNETTVPCHLRVKGASGQNRRGLDRTAVIILTALLSVACTVAIMILCLWTKKKRLKDSGTSANRLLVGKDASGNGKGISDRLVSGDDQEPSTPENNIPLQKIEPQPA